MLSILLLMTSAIPQPAVLPRPQEMRIFGGAPFVIDNETKLLGSAPGYAVPLLKQLLKRAAGIELKESAAAIKNAIVFAKSTDGAKAEGYRITVNRDRILIVYNDAAGALYAVQTLRQLLPTEIESSKKVNAKWEIPACEIVDYPRFGWRGMHLDVSRHFFPVKFIKKFIDSIAMQKMNVFHWHLIDDGGWRLQIPKYPKLTDLGAWRTDTGELWPGGAWNMGNLEFPGKDSGKKLYGGFYTVQEAKDIVRYAAERNVTVVPEIEMPGHALPALEAYPELGCENVEKSGLPKTNVFCAGNDEAIKFLQAVIDETMDIFPSKFIHIGADEVWKGFWKNCPKCQARMKAEGLANEEELQSWFVRTMEKYISGKGRRLIGWDEILEGGLAPGAAVMSWRGVSGGITAAKAGHDVVMSPTSYCYFDYPYSTTSTQVVYGYEPIPQELNEVEAKRILGAQANIWTEYIDTESRVEVMAFPRMLALAEVVWTKPERKDWNDFSTRLMSYYRRLDALGIDYFIEAPGVVTPAVLFDSTTTVEAKRVAGSPFTLRYTTDGTLPNGKSAEYKKAIKVSQDSTITFAYVSSSGVVGEPARVECKKVTPIRMSDDMKPGLDVSVYEGTWSKLPDFAKLVPASQSTVAGVNDSMATREENFGLRFVGFFSAPEDADYTFTLGSDDGSAMWLGGAKVIDNDGLHAFQERSGTVRLKKGLYPLEIGFFQAGGARKLEFKMSGGALYKKENG